MKKAILILTAILFAVTGILAQTPNQFKYQAVLRDASGDIMADESVTVDISIFQGSATGTGVFTESHNLTTTTQGLINLNIGSINDMGSIDWGADTYFVEITINGTVMGTSQLLSVPYALRANTVANDQVDDADADATNELQDLTLNGTLLEISDGTSADLSSLQDGTGTDDQTLSEVLSQNNSAGNANITNLADPVNDQDAATKKYVDELKEIIYNELLCRNEWNC